MLGSMPCYDEKKAGLKVMCNLDDFGQVDNPSGKCTGRS